VLELLRRVADDKAGVAGDIVVRARAGGDKEDSQSKQNSAGHAVILDRE
jgi:hypothetical protein